MEVSEEIGIPQNNMPELPEVETIKNVLNSFIKNRKINSIDVLRESIILGDKEEFVNILTNETFLYVSRIGKYLIFHLTNDKVIISHLRMEGKYFDYDINEENTKHARVIFYLDNNRKLIYDDSRCFGILKLSSEKTYLNEKEISKLGPEPFDIIDINYLYNLGKKSSLPIKTFLLDQSVMTGLGNIYVDETLFLSRIHPLTTAKEITLEQWQTILDNSVKVFPQFWNSLYKCPSTSLNSSNPNVFIVRSIGLPFR